MNTTDIQLSLDNDKFWLTYNIVKSPADGHYFIHSIAKSLGSQLPEHLCFKKEALLEKLKNETHENAHQYVDYIDGDGIQALYSGVNKYVTHKQYDTSYGDIVPFIMSNAICVNFMIIIQLADSYRVQLVECVENNRPTIILLKSGEHYDAITPNVHNTPIYSALPVNRTENDIQLTEMREMNDQGSIQNNCVDVLEVIQTPGSNVFNANIDTDDILPLSNTNLNWIKSNCNTHRYRYFNIYPWLHNSPLVLNKVNVCRRPMLNMGHLNIRSVPQHYNELLLLPLHQFDILCFSETN